MLTLRAVAPVRIPAHRERTAGSVAALRFEEFSLRYALATNDDPARGLRALRMLLADG